MEQPADTSRLRRSLHPMPEFVAQALREHGLTKTYEARPAYQRNDYIGWICRAKREETRDKRLRQMLDELAAGNAYMGMQWKTKSGQN